MGELESIRIFLAVAEHRSFAAAARALGLTPASVTRTVAALEDRLGVQLLLRTTRQVSLTAAGAVYAARTAPLEDALSRAAEETRSEAGLASGLIRVAAPMSLGLKVLPAVLSQFATLHPGIEVSVALSDHFVDILGGEFDLAIRISGPPSDKSTIWRKVCQVPRVLVAHPDYLTRAGTPETPADLAAHTCLAYSEDARPEIWDLSRGQSRYSHRATGSFTADNGDVLAELAAAGAGIALLPRFIVADMLADGRLTRLLPDWAPPEIWLTLYYAPYEKLPLRVATFSDFFEVHVKETAPL